MLCFALPITVLRSAHRNVHLLLFMKALQAQAHKSLRAPTNSRTRILPWLWMFYCLFSIGVAQSTSIRQLSFDQVAEQAELVFEGEVVVVEARWNADGSHIQTFVTFRIAEVLKGSHAPTSLTLSFVGGTVANTTEKFDGLIYPQFGENGIYFVENMSRPQLNPLVGWSQGHYKIIRHQGVDRMVTASQQPIVEMPEQKPIIGLKNAAEKSSAHVGGNHVIGLQVGDEIQTAVSKDDFKLELFRRFDQR